MESKLALKAVDTAKDWLVSAQANLEKKKYNLSIYSMEMSLEIALKAVIISLNVDFPKTHFMHDEFERVTKLNSRVLPEGLKSKSSEILDEFDLLIQNRNVGGYTFSSNISNEDLKSLAEDNITKVEEYVNICSKAVAYILTNSRSKSSNSKKE